MKQVHTIVPDWQNITDGTAETALTLGDSAYDLALLKPAIVSHPEEWVSP